MCPLESGTTWIAPPTYHSYAKSTLKRNTPPTSVTSPQYIHHTINVRIPHSPANARLSESRISSFACNPFTHCVLYYSDKERKYYFSPEKANYTIAKERCRQLGMRLVHIDDASENSFIHSRTVSMSIGTGPWIGLHESHLEGDWSWDDGCQLKALDYRYARYL